jgi:anti-sigma28 factor (negative regulator of flagellin synthesis)
MSLMTKQGKKQITRRDEINTPVTSQEMEKIFDILKRTPDVREDRVAALKKLIEAKEYRIPNEVLAEKMIKDSLLELKK